MFQKTIDLHTHSNISDGTFSPEELAFEAKKANLSAFALTDHDTTDGIKKARKAALANDIEFVSGVELSTSFEGKELHIVGLFIDENNPALLERLAKFRENRDCRNQKMYKKLQAEGFDISEEQLREMFPDAVLTRAHIARFLLEKEYVRSIPHAFDAYIGDNCKCYVPRDKITPEEAIQLIHGAGGKAVFAHPILCRFSDERLRRITSYLKENGLDAIEAVYSTYTPSEERQIRRLARETHLLLSGGSDFHGANKPKIKLGTGYGKLSVPYDFLEKLKQD